MHGYFSSAVTNPDVMDRPFQEYEACYAAGEESQRELKFHLTIAIDDCDRFIHDPQLTAKAEGYVECPALGGRLPVIKGIFNLFVPAHRYPDSDVVKEMHYQLLIRDNQNREVTFYGYKTIRRGHMTDVWSETTTLYTRLWLGDHDQPQQRDDLLGCGILHLTVEDFARQLTTFRTTGPSFWDRSRALYRFMEIFAENLWEAYRPQLKEAEPEVWGDHPIAVNTQEGVVGAQIGTYPVFTDDGLALTLTRFFRQATNQPVVLIHGLTSSSDMFMMPEHYNLVQYLLDQGAGDVWCLDWRGSRRFYYNLQLHRDTIDQVAMQDMPAALAAIKKIAGPAVRCHVICHCVGSIAFMASLATGQVSEIGSVVSNSVSLRPCVPVWSKVKLQLAPALVDYFLQLPYVSPQMGVLPAWSKGGLLAKLVSWFHRECDDKPCHMVSFMWGAGHPAAYLHKNLTPLTHERLADLFGGTSMHYYRHIRRMVKAGYAVPYKSESVPGVTNYFEAFLSRPQPPVLFVAGRENRIFPGSNRWTYESLKEKQPDADVHYLEFDDYGHQDIFMGRRGDQDVFPRLWKFLKANGAGES
jgi:triacylglycerol lipase/cholesterol oxidase